MKISPDEFVAVSPAEEIPGREFLKEVEFDPEICKIVVIGDSLSLTQEDHESWIISPEFWRRA